jgi:glycosyltransferase involved in cell wall biosynthesis
MDRLDGVGSFYDEVDVLADAVVANSPYVAETYRERYGREPHVILNGVDTALFRRLSSEVARSNTPAPRVMFTGSLQRRKHPEIVLDAARLFPKAQFVILGDGPLRPLLERRISEENLHNVTLLTSRNYESAARELVKADVFLFPSRAEGLPRVTLEAAAAGVPVLVFNDYRTPSVVDGETGFRVDTVAELMEKLGELIDNPSLRSTMGAAAVEHAGRFDWSVIVPQGEELFEEVLAAR